MQPSRRRWNLGPPPPRRLAGSRAVAVTAASRDEAVAIARTRPWWSRVLKVQPWSNGRRQWWFQVAG